MQWIVGTGFSRGIGFELAKLIQALDFKIFHIGRKACGFEDEFFKCDLSHSLSPESVRTLNLKLQKKNILGFFYGAGIFPMLAHAENDCDQMMQFWESQTKAMQVNYLSCAQLTEAILPFILHASNKPNKLKPVPFVAHFSSLAAVDPFPNFEFYGITKLATIKYFENLAKRFDSNQLLCLCLHPGTVKTDLVDGIIATQQYQDLAVVEMFKKAIQDNLLISAAQSAQLVCDFLFNSNYADMRKASNGKLYLVDKETLYTHRNEGWVYQ